MRLKSRSGTIIRKTADEIMAGRTPADIERLRAAMNGPIDTSEIPERLGPARYPLIRDAKGNIPKKPPSAIRDAILRELGRRKMTRYELWKRAKKHCRTLPDSAVYEFLLGQRAIGVDYCEALLKALDLEVRRARKSA
jgi:hypothetical protein